MHNLIPQFILEKHNCGDSGGQFATAALMADISGFSAVTHALMAHGSEASEVMAEIMLAIFEPLIDAVHAQAGFVATFAGDAFTALFPAQGEDTGIFRALAAAAAIQQYMIAHPVQATIYGSFPFAIKLGLGEGEVAWGILRPCGAPSIEPTGTGGLGQKAAYYFSGPAVESAAVAEHQAKSGMLVLSPGTYSQVHAVVKALPLAEGYWHCLELQGELPAPQPWPQPADLVEVEADFIPEVIRQRGSRGDFRQVVSVFIQLQGIETRQDLDIFMQAIFSLIRQFDGYLNRVDFGDKGCNLLLYWGMPISHENDIWRALEFVLELGNHTPGSFRAGLTYCAMYAGLSGSAARGEYTCYGDGINLAARLMVCAPWGSLWLDERLAERARVHFVTEYVDHLAFKGFAEKQPVHALVERRLPGESFFAGRMIGRERELASLSAFVQPLFAPQGERRFAGLLALVGEPGLGKSRLAYEFLTGERWPVAGAAQVFICQADQVLRQPFNPFRYWLQRYFDQSPTQSSERNKRAFGRKLEHVIAAVGQIGPQGAGLAQELNRTRSCLGVLVGLEWESSLYARLDPQGRYENTLQALQALLKAESLRQPVVLVLEDVQWLDEDSQTFVRLLCRELELYPLAVLATARPERDGALFGARQPYQQVDLACFSGNELEALAADRLGGPASPELLALLARRAEDNPFFAEQILLYLHEQGHLVQVDGRWELAAGGGEGLLPDRVRSIFIARLDRLAAEIQEVVQAAAVLGREFEVRILAQMLANGQPPGLERQLGQAEQERIWSSISQLRYLFKHALLRDAAYEMQLKTRRRWLHRLAASVLEQVYAAELAAHVGEIAYHYEAACLLGLEAERPQALHYLEEAGKEAARRWENRDAVAYYTRALALLESGADASAEALGQRLRLLLAREGIDDLLGERDAQRADLSAVEALVQLRQRPAEQAELGLRQASLAKETCDYAQAQAAAQAAADAARTAGEVGLESRAHQLWSGALLFQTNYAGAAEHGHLALALAEAGGHQDLQAAALHSLGNISGDQANYAVACLYWEQSLAINREIGNRRGEFRTLNNLGAISAYQCDYAAARLYWEQALAICQEIGLRSGVGLVLYNLGCILALQGDYAAARSHYEQALVISQEIGKRSGVGSALCGLGSIFAVQGDYAAARSHYEQSLSIWQEIGDRRVAGTVFNELGNTFASQGDPAAARSSYEQALAIFRELELAHYLAESLSGLAECALVQGDPAAAQAAVLEMLPILEANPPLDGSEHPFRALLGCGRTLLALGDRRGWAILEQAHAGLQEQSARMPDEAARRMFLENVPENRALCALYAQLQNGEPVIVALEAANQALPGAPGPVGEAALPGQPALPVEPAPQADALEPPTPPVAAPVSPSPAPGLDMQALAAQITALLGQAAKAQGTTLVILGDVHIHIDRIELGQPPITKTWPDA